MKKWSFKSFLAGVLAACLVLGLCGTALAASNVMKELYYNDIKIRLNGKAVEAKDAKGNKVEPFIIEGTTYLPVRAVAEALGLTVSWDGKTQTAVLGNDPEMKQPAKWLGEMETFVGTASENVAEKVGLFAGTANDGSQYERVLTPGSDETSYLLKGQYKKFTGTFFLTESSKNGDGSDPGSVAQIQVFVDDVLVFTSKEMKVGELPQEFTVDVTGGYKMDIVYEKYFTGWHKGVQTYCTPIANAALWS